MMLCSMKDITSVTSDKEAPNKSLQETNLASLNAKYITNNLLETRKK